MKLCRMCHNFTLQIILSLFIWSDRPVWAIKMNKRHTEKEANDWLENLKKYLDDLEEKGIQITEKNVIIERTKKKYVVKGTDWRTKSIYFPISFTKNHRTIGAEERATDG